MLYHLSYARFVQKQEVALLLTFAASLRRPGRVTERFVSVKVSGYSDAPT